MKNSKGQVIAETAILMLLIPFLVSGMIYFSKLLLIHQKLAMAARYGAFLASSQRVNRSVAANEVIHFLTEDEPKLNRNHIPEPEFSRFKPQKRNSAAGFYKLIEVKVTYNIKVPSLLRRFLTSGNGYYTLTEKCVVQEATGALSYKKGLY